MPYLPILLALVVLVAVMVYVVVVGQSRGSARLTTARRRVQELTDLAYSHVEISPALAGAVIERTRGLNADSSVHSLEAAIEDVLALSLSHRESEPDLSVIMVDTARRDDGPRQLG